MTDWTIADLTARYAAVLRQLLPAGGYDRSPDTVAAQDIYAHAKVLAQADKNGRRILQFLQSIPVELLDEVETEIGLPLTCSVPDSKTLDERLAIVNWVKNTHNVFNRQYLEALLALFGVTLLDMKKYVPIRCTAQCTEPVNSERLRYKVRLYVADDVTADMQCIIEHYLPAYLRVDVEWVPRRFMTSLPYALYDVESMSTDLVIENVTLRDTLNRTALTENVGTSFAVVGAQITREIRYLNTAVEPESVGTSFAVVGAQITREIRYLNTSVDPESVGTSFAVVGAQITREVQYLNTNIGENISIDLMIDAVRLIDGE